MSGGLPFLYVLRGSCERTEYMLPRSCAVYSLVCGWERGSSCLWYFYSETTIVQRGCCGVAAGIATNVLSISSFIDTVRRIT